MRADFRIDDLYCSCATREPANSAAFDKAVHQTMDAALGTEIQAGRDLSVARHVPVLDAVRAHEAQAIALARCKADAHAAAPARH